MTEPAKNIASEFSGRKVIIAIAFAITLSLVILTFSNRFNTPNLNNPYFSYGAGNNRNGPIHVIDNRRTEIPIVFVIDQGVSEVSLAFSGVHDGDPGISMTDDLLAVVNGRAVSKVIIEFNSKPDLRAGTHFLRIVAQDPSTGKIIRSGEIKFSYNMHEVIAKCSC